jgi:hypothetical protein
MHTRTQRTRHDVCAHACHDAHAQRPCDTTARACVAADVHVGMGVLTRDHVRVSDASAYAVAPGRCACALRLASQRPRHDMPAKYTQCICINGYDPHAAQRTLHACNGDTIRSQAYAYAYAYPFAYELALPHPHSHSQSHSHSHSVSVSVSVSVCIRAYCIGRDACAPIISDHLHS